MKIMTTDKVEGKLVDTVVFEGTPEQCELWLEPRYIPDNEEFGRVYWTE